METKSKEKRNKNGISLIVLVITIIVMIILAAAVIISLSNSGIIGKANEAVDEMNLKQAQTIAQTIWIESQHPKEDATTIKNKIIAALGGENVANKYIIEVNENGVTVKIKEDDKTAPTLTIITPESNDVNNPTIIDTETITLSGKVTDDDSIKDITIEYSEGESTKKIVITIQDIGQDGSWSYTLTLTKDETTTITVVATDVSGNTTTETRYVSYVKIEPGLYKTGSNYTQLLKSWDTLISEGIITADGKIVSGKESRLNGDLMISDTITEIIHNSYKSCSNLTGVLIPEGVTKIGNAAFANCTQLASANIPDGVISIGIETFYNCSLTNISVPDSVTSIGTSVFASNETLKNVSLGDGITVIAARTFKSCELSNINMSENITSIGAEAFDGCSGITSIGPTGSGATIEISDNLTSVSDSAFNGCKNLTSVIIPKGVTSIGNAVFSNCPNIASLEVGHENTTYHSEGDCIIKTVDKKLIYGCKNSIIPTDESVTYISVSAFLRLYRIDKHYYT